ncbi:unnamed protein product [Gongylonema pulchrum]|uniref:MMS19 nucleotide excision repair protein n=1 Tax=Gongylonema pulchrum TaxID=637853 RepID=A0A183E263_9BILA|nr:unnamed protein product [Gongylonema pulchrum]
MKYWISTEVNQSTMKQHRRKRHIFRLETIKKSGKNDARQLTEFLQILLAESINGQDKALSAQIREVLRCLSAFDDRGEKTLIGECLVDVLVRFYLEERDLQLRRFIIEFQTLKAQVFFFCH